MAGELGFDTGPFVNAAFFCDRVIKGDDGVLSAIRIVDSISIEAQGPDAPDELPPGVAETTLLVILRAGQALGAQTVQINLEYPDGTRKLGPEQAVNFSPGASGGINLIVPLTLEVQSAGLYWTDVLVNKRLVTRVPLLINYGFRRIPAPGAPSS